MNGLTNRLFAIIELLQGQRKLTTQALAEHFGVSERTIRRDLTRLQDLEIELDILPGRNGGVKLLRGNLLQALRFTVPSVRLKPPPLGGQISSVSLGKWNTATAVTQFSTSSTTSYG